MTGTQIKIAPPSRAALADSSTRSVRGGPSGNLHTLSTIIPDYRSRVRAHYRLGTGALPAGPEFEHFGLLIEYDRPTEVEVYDDDWVLDPTLKELVAEFGPVVLRNAYMSAPKREEGQRNIFPSLVFHLDRGRHFENRYSLFVRDPFDPVQRHPRKSSTLIISNNVAQLEAKKDGEEIHPNKPRYNIFTDSDVRPLIGELMVEQEWSAPEGTGELCVIDNRSVYHASYYDGDKGYPIGVRYLY